MAKYASFKRRGKKDTAPNAKTRRHNSRTGRDEKHFLPKELRLPNYHLHPIPSGKKIDDIVANEKKENEERYAKHHRRKLRSDAVRVESALLILSEEQVKNCDPNDIWDKCLEFKDWFELEFNTKIRAMDWHRDEGSLDEFGELLTRNNHVHIEYDNVDERGQMVRRKFSKGTLHKLQDKTAEIFKPLGFERGNDSRQDPNYTVKRGLSIKEYRAKMKKEKAEKAKIAVENNKKFNSNLIANSKDLKQKNTELKEEQASIRSALQELQAERPVYAMLEQQNKEMKKDISTLERKVKSKDLTIEELNKNFEDYEKRYGELKEELAVAVALNSHYKEKLLELQQTHKDDKKDIISDINSSTNTRYLLDKLSADKFINMEYFGSNARGTTLQYSPKDEEWEDVTVWQLLVENLEMSEDEALKIAVSCSHDDVKAKVTKHMKLSL